MNHVDCNATQLIRKLMFKCDLPCCKSPSSSVVRAFLTSLRKLLGSVPVAGDSYFFFVPQVWLFFIEQ